MIINFRKYQGTGNDFIMVDNRENRFRSEASDLVKRLCDRRFGIGADGLILLNNRTDYDFEMVYFNSDGKESSMCGNGGRCIIQFAKELQLINHTCKFMAVDGAHEGYFLPDGQVALRMNNVSAIETVGNDCILNTGSPHYVVFVPCAEKVKLPEQAQLIRYADRFAREGINVNFVEVLSEHEIFVRTYERGVEAETLSCGTGVVAASLSFAKAHPTVGSRVLVHTLGGKLEVRFTPHEAGFRNIELIGPAVKVFEGTVVA